MNLVRLVRVAIAVTSLAPAAGQAEVFVSDAADYRNHPILFDARLIGGQDWVSTSMRNEGGAGLRLGLDFGVADRTRLDFWGSALYGGSICVDGTSVGANPYLGCYALNVGAIGVTVHQGLIVRPRVHVGLEGGASVRNEPAGESMVAIREHVGPDANLVLGPADFFARTAFALSETTRVGTLDTYLMVGGGVELAAGPVRPLIEVDYTRSSADLSRTQAQTGLMLMLGLGVVMDDGAGT